MQKLFTNILLPVRLNNQTGTAVSKSIELANELDCNLHVLVVFKPSFWMRLWHSTKGIKRLMISQKQRLQDIREEHGKKMQKGLLLTFGFREGDPEKAMIEQVLSRDIDLICIGDEDKNLSVRWARQMGCAILVSHSGELLHHFQKIVLPIYGSIPINRIRIAIYLAHHFRAVIHLFAKVKGDNSKANLSTLEKTYCLLREHTDLKVVCTTGTEELEKNIQNPLASPGELIVLNASAGLLRGSFIGKMLHGRSSLRSARPLLLVN